MNDELRVLLIGIYSSSTCVLKERPIEVLEEYR